MAQFNTLPTEAQANLGMTHEMIVDYSDLTDTAGTTKTFTFTLPAGSLVLGGPHILETDFTDGAATMSSLVYIVGDGDNDDIYLSSTEVETTGTEVDYKVATNTGIPHGKVYASADTLDVKFTATGANLSTLTGGKLRYLFKLTNLAGLKN